MDDTPNLQLPYLFAEQALKHVTHNEALQRLDAIVQLSVADRDLTTPPAAPEDGDRYLVAVSATDDWAGMDDAIAAWQNGAWVFYAPQTGWRIWVADEETLLAWNGSAWVIAGGGVNPVALVGVNTTADAVNRLSVKSDAVLFGHDDVTPGSGDMQLKLNKSAAGNTGSVLFQTGYSGRAEFGLCGDDDWHVKVSADGTAWIEALVVNGETGVVSFPNGLSGVRPRLSGNRTYFVDATNGSDANDGLSSGSGAFATLQKAWDTLSGLDGSLYTGTISVADGTYAAGIVSSSVPVGFSQISIIGNSGAPANVHVNGTGHGFSFGSDLPCPMAINGFRITCAGASKSGVALNARGTITCSNIEAAGGSTGYAGFYSAAAQGARIIVAGTQTITGSMSCYAAATYGVVQFYGQTIALTGTPAFSWGFAIASYLGVIAASGLTFSGAATGVRYGVTINSAISTGSGGAGYFPGDAAGSAASGGQYL